MSSSEIFCIYGAAGCGRGVMPLLRQQLASRNIPFDNLVFVDDGQKSGNINGHAVMSYDEFLSIPASMRHIVLAVANSRIREKLALRCVKDCINPLSIMANNVVMMDEVKIGEGYILCPFVAITSNIVIGRYFHANLYSYIEHDCVIGDFVTFAPAVKCNGNIVIEDHVYIGAGAVIKQGLPNRKLVIGRGATIGMGAVVTKSIPAGATVVGNPARIVKGKD